MTDDEKNRDAVLQACRAELDAVLARHSCALVAVPGLHKGLVVAGIELMVVSVAPVGVEPTTKRKGAKR